MLIGKNSFLSSASLAVMVLSLSAIGTPAFAGFEWTPPEKTAPVPLPAPERPPVNIPLDSDALPEVGNFDVPSEEEQAPPPVEYRAPSHQDGKMKTIKMKKDQPSETAVPAPAPVEPEKLEPVPQPAPSEPFPLTETAPPVQEETTPAPVKEQKPTETPASSSGLNINPYPLEGGQAQPTAPSAGAADTINWQGGFEVVEGFGSDMPLALALQQVVPPRYAFSFGSGVNAGHLVSWEGGKPWDQVLRSMIAPIKLQAVIQGNVVKIVSANASASVAPALETVTPMQETPKEAAPKEAALEPLPPLQGEAQADVKATEAVTPEPVKQEEAKKEEVKKEPAPVKEAAAPAEKKASSKRNVILDPGESKPMTPANTAKKKDAASEEKTAMTPEVAPEAAPPSETNLESAKTQPDAKASAKQLGQPRIWEAKRGSSLKQTLETWTQQANVALTWNVQEDVNLKSDILISGTFENAVKVLFAQAVKKGPAHTLKTSPSAELVVGEEVVKG